MLIPKLLKRGAVALALVLTGAACAQTPGPEFRRAVAGHWVAEYRVAGADGTELQTLVYLPGHLGGPYPTLVTRSPYDLPLTPVSGFPEDHPNADLEASDKDIGWVEATDRGYALVIQFIRGRNESNGTFSLFLNERADGEALLRWVENQRWSDRRIGVFGDSASGVVALQAAGSGRDSVKAIYAQATSADFLGGVIFPERHVKWEALLPFVLSQSLDSSADHRARLGLSADALEALEGQAGEALGELFGALEEGDALVSPWWRQLPRADLPVVSQLQPRWAELVAARDRPSVLAANDVSARLRAPVLQVSLWHDFFHDSAMREWSRGRAGGSDDRLLVLDGTHYDIDDPELWPYRPMFTGGPLEGHVRTNSAGL
jgi:putative CocE/NonD family hydrolase